MSLKCLQQSFVCCCTGVHGCFSGIIDKWGKMSPCQKITAGAVAVISIIGAGIGFGLASCAISGVGPAQCLLNNEGDSTEMATTTGMETTADVITTQPFNSTMSTTEFGTLNTTQVTSIVNFIQTTSISEFNSTESTSATTAIPQRRLRELRVRSNRTNRTTYKTPRATTIKV